MNNSSVMLPVIIPDSGIDIFNEKVLIEDRVIDLAKIDYVVVSRGENRCRIIFCKPTSLDIKVTNYPYWDLAFSINQFWLQTIGQIVIEDGNTENEIAS